MSKKVWIGIAVFVGLYCIGKMLPDDPPRKAHAAAAQTITYTGPQLARTNWVVKDKRDPMTGESIYDAYLASSDDPLNQAVLQFECGKEASLNLTIVNPGDDVSNQDHINFDAKVGDSDVFQVFGLKLGSQNYGANFGTTFQLEEDALEKYVHDGFPVYLRYQIGRNIKTIMFVPNETQSALAPIRRCTHG